MRNIVEIFSFINNRATVIGFRTYLDVGSNVYFMSKTVKNKPSLKGIVPIKEAREYWKMLSDKGFKRVQ